jgi:predicted Ser/Thr protein kinase
VAAASDPTRAAPPAASKPAPTRAATAASIPDAAALPAFLVPPARGGAAPSPTKADSIPSGRTVPIAVENTSIPVLNPAKRSPEVRQESPREVVVGDVLRSRYEIKNVLGLGGTGTVFEAIDRYRLDLPESGQRVAIKVLHSGTAGQAAVLTDLRREFQLLQSLSHPNIVRAHEYDRDGDTAFFTMEYLSGLSLESVLSAHRDVVLGRAHALIIIRDVAAALEHAHTRGVVHGDLNPGNIFITNDGEIRVLDFGAAHTPSESPTVTESAWDATAYATPRYASAQLLDGERADVRDDTYSLACVLYVLMAGKHPFGELNAAQARAQRLKPSRPPGLSGYCRLARAVRSAQAGRAIAGVACALEISAGPPAAKRDCRADRRGARFGGSRVVGEWTQGRGIADCRASRRRPQGRFGRRRCGSDAALAAGTKCRLEFANRARAGQGGRGAGARIPRR